MKALDQDLDRIHRGECDVCGWAGHWDEFDNLPHYGTVCEECWDRIMEEDPSMQVEYLG